MRKKMIDSVLYDLTAEDLQQMEIDKIEFARIKVIEDAQKEKRASGKAKLIALGLTEEEVKETFGI
jgi:hypothetical protein|tara:strand:+ start:543 stop:740 length:198 start_codon:yes stop_codon:yes gene_type:complete